MSYTLLIKHRQSSLKTVCYWLCALSLPGIMSCSEHNAGLQEPEPVGGPVLMRRLSESQYRATIADIFGPDTPIVARFERGLRSHGLQAIGSSESGMSPFSIEQYAAAALGIAEYVLNDQQRTETVHCQPDDPNDFDAACSQQFIDHYATLILRRPPTAEQQQRFFNAAQAGYQKLGNFYQGLQYALVSMLTAPEFLLRIERQQTTDNPNTISQLDAYSKAERLSFFLTNSSPDAQLLAAAEKGELETTAGLTRQVDRLVASPKFAKTLRAFFTDMLEFELFDDLTKDINLYPAFDAEVAADAQEQTLRDITRHLIDNNGDYRDLFTLRETELTRPLGVVYRLPVATRDGWEKTQFPVGSHRAGIQSHISFLALHSHPGRSSPTLRGKAIREVFLCQEVPDPPADVDFSAVQDADNAAMPTARDRLKIHNNQPACSGCHKIMDPPGLALENFDGLGTYRSQESDTNIDASGNLDGMAFNEPQEFAQALRDHRETPRCVVEKMYRYAVGRDTVWQERAYMDYLIEGFKADGYRLPDLMRSIALSDNFFTINTTSDQHRVATQHRQTPASEKGEES